MDDRYSNKRSRLNDDAEIRRYSRSSERYTSSRRHSAEFNDYDYDDNSYDDYGHDDYGYDDYDDESEHGRYPARLTKAQGTHVTKRPRKLLKIILIILAVLIVAAAIGVFLYTKNIESNLNRNLDEDVTEALVETDMSKEPFYVLLLGTDRSEERDADEEIGGSYRADSMMLARVDPVNKKATLVSLDRDTQVSLDPNYDGYYYDFTPDHCKLNETYAYGGPALTIKTVAEIAGVDISHYAEIDFDGFVAVVDALGGVDVDVPVDIDDWMAGGSVEAGYHTLSGEEALILARSRNTYNETSGEPDNMRAANQRLVLSAIAKKMLDADVGTIANTITALSEYVTTDLSLNDIVGICQIMRGIDPLTDIYTAGMPTYAEYIDEIWYSFIVEDEWEEMMSRVRAGQPPTEGNKIDEATGTIVAMAGTGDTEASVRAARVDVVDGAGRSSVVSDVVDVLTDNGFIHAMQGDDTVETFPHSEIVYHYSSQRHEAEQIQEILGQGYLIQDDPDYGDYIFDGDFLIIIGEDFRSTLMKRVANSAASGSASGTEMSAGSISDRVASSSDGDDVGTGYASSSDDDEYDE